MANRVISFKLANNKSIYLNNIKESTAKAKSLLSISTESEQNSSNHSEKRVLEYDDGDEEDWEDTDDELEKNINRSISEHSFKKIKRDSETSSNQDVDDKQQ